MSGPSPSLSEQRARRTRVAVAVSVLLHVLLGIAFLRSVPWFVPPRPERFETTTVRQTLALEKRVERRHVAAAPPKPVHRAQQRTAPPKLPARPAPPVEKVQARPPELTKTAPKAPPRLPSTSRAPVDVTPGKVRNARPQLSGQQLAQIESDLGDSIAKDRAEIDSVKVASAPAPTMKHYAADYAELSTGERRGGGLCDPVKSWTDEGFDYYYVACNVHFSDGSVERQGVPWPIRFDPKDDPFSGTAHDVNRPIAMPLPGWHPSPGETITVFMREYAHAHGVDI